MGYESWTVEIEFTAGVWTDVTRWVDTSRGGPPGVPFAISGGDTPEASADAGGFALPLLNYDQRFTPLNALSPYSPNVVPGKRCRIRDVIADQVIPLATGYLQFPEIESWAGGNSAEPRDQIIMVPFVDLVAFVADSRMLGSALTEHIRYNGGTDLDGLWPLTNEQPPFFGVGPTTKPITITRNASGSMPPQAKEIPSAGDAPNAAEGSGLRCTLITDVPAGSEAYQQVNLPDTFLPAIGTGDSITIVWWWSLQTASIAGFQQIAVFNLFGSSTITIEILRDPTTGVWTATASGAQSASITIGAVGLDALLPIAVRYCASPANMEIWVGSMRLTTTPTGAAPTGMFLGGASWGFHAGAYDISGIQVYTGQTWGYSDYLTQIAEADAPLAYQTTGERIRTALAYAGITLPMYRIDPGVAVMQPTTMAGRKAPDLIEVAVETEQGEYYADGDGLPVFADRQRIYNV